MESNIQECDVCGESSHITDDCPEIQPENEVDESHLAPALSLAKQTLPTKYGILWVDKYNREEVICKSAVPARTKLGVLVAKPGRKDDDSVYQLGVVAADRSEVTWYDTSNENECNWLCLIKPAPEQASINCMAFQIQNQIQFSTTCDVKAGDALLVWYAKGYARKLQKPEFPPVTVHDAGLEVPGAGGDPPGNPDSVPEEEQQHIHITDEEHVENLEMLECQFLYSCDVCGDVAFNSLQDLEQHMKQHELDDQRQIVQSSVPQQDDFGSRVEVTEKSPTPTESQPATELPWRCSKCEFKTDLPSALALHITSEHLETSVTPAARKRVWTCKACGIAFSNPKSLGVHKKKHCSVLKLSAAEEQPLDDKIISDDSIILEADHPDLMSSTNPHKRVWTCKVCGTVFTNPRSLGEHKKKSCTLELSATDTPPIDNQLMDMDDTQLPTDDNYEAVMEINLVIEKQPEPAYGRGLRKRKKPKHLEEVMLFAEEDEQTCPHCNEVIEESETLGSHIEKNHAFSCSTCNVIFTSEESFRKHLCKSDMFRIDIEPYKTVSEVNTTETENATHLFYTCFFCEEVHTDPKIFHEHLAWHCLNLPCDVCKSYCGPVDDLEAHVLTCAGKVEITDDDLALPQSQCAACGLMLTADGITLQVHMSIHSDYKCKKCVEQFNTRFGLQKHLLTCDQSQLEDVSPVFACLECNSVFSTQIGLEYHNKDHTETDFACRDCQQGYQLLEAYEAHECQAKEGEFVCEICDRRFRTNKSLTSHYLKHTLSFTCTICQHSFDKKEELIDHSLECSAQDMLEKTGRIDCAHCEENFSTFAEYKEHLSIHTHSFECKHCNRRFRKKYQHIQHGPKCPLRPRRQPAVRPQAKGRAERNVLVDSNYTCPICQKLFIRKDYFLNHQCRGPDGQVINRPADVPLLMEDDSTPAVVCFQCGKTFSSQSSLTQHLKIHGDKKFSCEVCGKMFYDIYAKRVHYESTHTDKLQVQCELCKKTYRNKYSLHTHMRHFHANTISCYACAICGKKFRQKGNMQKHMMAHDASKHYTCQYCNKTFKYPEQLKKHSLLHTHGKAFCCELCDRRFLVQYELNKHIKEMHSNKIYVCSFCNETCRWKHTMRRHIKRKHPRHAHVVEDPNYMNSLLRETAEVDDSNHMTVHTDLTNHVSNQSLVISMESLTADQIVELDEQIVGQVTEEGGTIQLYNHNDETYLPQAAAEALQKLSSSISQPQQQQLIISGQQFTINFANGQTILTPVDMDTATDTSAVGTSLLRTHHAGIAQALEGSDSPQIDDTGATQVVISSQGGRQVEAELAEAAEVLLSNDGGMAYNTDGQHQADNAVSFTDISQLTDSNQDDGNKMMFFNILAGNPDSANQ